MINYHSILKIFEKKRMNCTYVYTTKQNNLFVRYKIFVSKYFIPTAVLHFGEICKAGMRYLKHHLERIIGNTNLMYEESISIKIKPVQIRTFYGYVEF